MRRLHEAGLTTREACGNSVRNVTACELAEVCSGAAFDVTPYAEAIARHFLRHPLSSTLPRKFKIAFSGCGTDCAFGAIHDIGFIAQVKRRAARLQGVRGGRAVDDARRRRSRCTSSCPPARSAASARRSSASFTRSATARTRPARASSTSCASSARRRSAPSTPSSARRSTPRRRPSWRCPSSPHNAPAPAVEGAGAQPPGYLAWRSSNVIDQKQDGLRRGVRPALPRGHHERADARARRAPRLASATAPSASRSTRTSSFPGSTSARCRRSTRRFARSASRGPTCTRPTTSRRARAPSRATSR